MGIGEKLAEMDFRVPYGDITDPAIIAYLDDLPNRVWGETEADRQRHLEARSLFMNLLSDHLERQGVFLSWTYAADLYLATREMGPIDLSSFLRSVKQALAPAQAEAERGVMMMKLRAVIPIIVQLASTHVFKELHLEWDWVVCDLGLAWFIWLEMYSLGKEKVTIKRAIKPYYLPYESAQPKQFHFEDRPGESAAVRLARFKAETERFYKEQEAELRRLAPKGKLYSNQDVPAYVEYFFRMAIRHEKSRRIAHYTLDGRRRESELDRRNLEREAEKARKWLSFGYSKANVEKVIEEIARVLNLGEEQKE